MLKQRCSYPYCNGKLSLEPEEKGYYRIFCLNCGREKFVMSKAFLEKKAKEQQEAKEDAQRWVKEERSRMRRERKFVRKIIGSFQDE